MILKWILYNGNCPSMSVSSLRENWAWVRTIILPDWSSIAVSIGKNFSLSDLKWKFPLFQVTTLKNFFGFLCFWRIYYHLLSWLVCSTFCGSSSSDSGCLFLEFFGYYEGRGLKKAKKLFLHSLWMLPNPNICNCLFYILFFCITWYK